MEMGLAIILYLVGLVILIVINSLIAGEFANIAAEKGFERRRYWHFCFWLGFVGYLIVIALPNRNLTELCRVLSGMKVGSAESKTTVSAPRAAANYLPEL